MKHTASRTTVPYLSGHIDAESIIVVPHSEMFDDIDIATETADAKVRINNCRCLYR